MRPLFASWLALAASAPSELVEWLQARRSEFEVVVVCTTTPKRISRSLEAALSSAFRQSIRPDRLVLSLPRGKMKFREYTYPEDTELPVFLQKPWPGLVVDRETEDLGPGTSFYNGLKYAERQDAFVMNMADDQVLGFDHIAILLFSAAQEELKGTSIGAAGVHSLPQFLPCANGAQWTSGCGMGRVNYGMVMGPVILGTFSHVVRPWFFGPEGFKPPDATWPTECHMHDDLWMAAILARKGIRRRALNSGILAKTELQDTGLTSDALFWQNMRNLKVCNQALLERFPGLWEPRPRLVVLGGYDVRIADCLGHVDHWHQLPARLASRPKVRHVRYLMKQAAFFEHGDTLAIFSQGTCQTLSAVLQCALQNPGPTNRNSTIATFPNREASGLCVITTESTGGSTLTVAGTLRMWQAPVVKADEQEKSCWTLPDATWGRCCARYREGTEPGESRDQGFRRISGCPVFDCCAMSHRLSNSWSAVAGTWVIKYEDGKEFKVYIHQDGLVEDPKLSRIWQLENTAVPFVGQLQSLLWGANLTSGQDELRFTEPISERWTFTNGEVAIVGTKHAGSYFGRGVQKTCEGCV